MWLTFQDEEKDKNKNNKSKKQDIIHFHVQEYYIHTIINITYMCQFINGVKSYIFNNVYDT